MSEFEEKLNQLYEQGIFESAPEKRIKELDLIKSNLPKMNKDVKLNKALKLFKALGNKNRLLILWLLLKGVRCACEIEQILNLSQSTVSHHINTLVDVGLLDAVKKGKWNLVEVQESTLTDDLLNDLIKSLLT